MNPATKSNEELEEEIKKKEKEIEKLDKDIEKLDKDIEKLDSKLKDHDERLENFLNTAFQLASYYFVFQGVIFTAIFNAKSPACKNRWFLFTLSALAITVNLVAVVYTGYKYYKRSFLRQETWEEHTQKVDERRRLRRKLPPQPQLPDVDPSRKDKWEQLSQMAVLTVSSLAFVAFGVITLIGCWFISCQYRGGGDDGASQDHGGGANAGNCVTICEGLNCMKLCQYSKK